MITTYVHDSRCMPRQATPESNCFDVVASVPTTINPGEVKIVPTGIKMVADNGSFVKMYARSSLPIKYGLMLANGVGVIDTDYRGEWGLILYNFSDKPVTIKKYERMAQVEYVMTGVRMFECVTKEEWENLSETYSTSRGAGGYGSTGNI